MRRILVYFLVCVVALPAALAAALLLAIDDHPRVTRRTEPGPEHLARANQIIKENDPRRLQTGEVRTVSVTQEELDLAVGYLARRYADANTSVTLRPGIVDLSATLRLPANPIGQFVNLEAVLVAADGLLRVDRLRVGRVPVPVRLAKWLLAHGPAAMVDELVGTARLVAAIEQVRVVGHEMRVTYRWQSGTAEGARAALIPPRDQQRLLTYQALLTALVQTTKSPVSLAVLMSPMLTKAAERSRDDQESPQAENRAAILVLATYAHGTRLSNLVAAAAHRPEPPRRRITLNGRIDLAQHFIVSAALSASAGEPLSDALGIYKEVEDKRSGSGFSFNDLAADRAGTRLGTRAVASALSARRLQSLAAAGFRESDFMPVTADLPEFLRAAEFERRYGGLGGAGYNRLLAEIDRRIAGLPVNR